MKILITENQLDKIILKYISNQFENTMIEEIDMEEDGLVIYGIKYKSGQFNFAEIQSYYGGAATVYVDDIIWNQIHDMFSLSYEKTVEFLKEFFQKKYPGLCDEIDEVVMQNHSSNDDDYGEEDEYFDEGQY